jgi:hypothetical protein
VRAAVSLNAALSFPALSAGEFGISIPVNITKGESKTVRIAIRKKP